MARTFQYHAGRFFLQNMFALSFLCFLTNMIKIHSGFNESKIWIDR
jgi:hypothetical protein